MIAYIEGEIVARGDTSITVLAGGVGYRVFITENTLSALANENMARLNTHMAVRETAMDLYGFLETEELQFFELLLSVSGIGPKSALGVLTVAPIATLKEAVLANDHSYLTKVSGIGNKSAQKIVLELQGKLDGIATTETSMREDLDTLEALEALGYSQHEIRQVLQSLPKEIENTNDKIKEALKLLGK